jgi:hypothetical protein
MAREEIPISPEQVPDEARMYMAALQPHQGHPFVRQHFDQVTWLSFDMPGSGKVDFFALEFRVGHEAALIWSDTPGKWQVGRWLPLAHAEADVTCPPSPMSLQYFLNSETERSLVAAIDQLAKSKQFESADNKKEKQPPGKWRLREFFSWAFGKPK